MPVITIFSGNYCHDMQVVSCLKELTGYPVLTDEDIVNKAESLSGEPADNIQTAFSHKASRVNTFNIEQKLMIAYLRLAAAEYLSSEPFILSGYSSLLIPSTVQQAVRVCLIAHKAYRQDQARMDMGITQKKAVELITLEDETRSAWTQNLLGVSDPWHPPAYDAVLPMDKMSAPKAASIIHEAALKMPTFPQEKIMITLKDFELSSVIQTKLLLLGHDVDVYAHQGRINIKVTKPVLMKTRLEEELKSHIEGMTGVEMVLIDFKQSNGTSLPGKNYPESDFSKILLVDDEREFVQTLSERLQMREMESTAVYDGQAALDCVEKDDPEVMIIDLKMPGIDGMEVLRRTKQTRPEIEVIVLTGHGSEQDKLTCMSYGAFAYLHKPVDIDLLSQTLKAANEKIKRNK